MHKNVRNQDTALFLKLIEPYKHDIVVSAESTYAWYWLADLCADEAIEFILWRLFTEQKLKAKFEDKDILKSLETNLKLIEKYDQVIRELEVYILQHTREEYRQELNIIQTIHGIGEIIALTILYKMDTIERLTECKILYHTVD